MSSPEGGGRSETWMSEPDRAPSSPARGSEAKDAKSRGMKKLAGMDLEELRRVADVGSAVSFGLLCCVAWGGVLGGFG